jgi:hypothetical protein
LSPGVVFPTGVVVLKDGADREPVLGHGEAAFKNGLELCLYGAEIAMPERNRVLQPVAGPHSFENLDTPPVVAVDC